MRIVTTWVVVAGVCGVPLLVAALSPLLEWRAPIYIAAGFSGVTALLLLLLQPLLAAKLLPGINPLQARTVHRAIGFVIALLVIFHVIGLWVTSPPDVVDALLFVSATPFSAWGVVAMWSVFLTAVLVVLRRQIAVRVWRIVHRLLACVTVVGTVTHALMIEGTMGYGSKLMLCACVVLATSWALFKDVNLVVK